MKNILFSIFFAFKVRKRKSIYLRGPLKIRPLFFNFNDPQIDIEKEGRIYIGKNVLFSRNIYLQVGKGQKINIGDNVKIGAFSEIHGEVDIKNNVLLAPFCFMSSGTHNISLFENSIRKADSIKPVKDKPIVIEENSWLCRGSHISPGITVGNNSVVGSYTVLKENVPPYSVAITSPKLNIISRLT